MADPGRSETIKSPLQPVVDAISSSLKTQIATWFVGVLIAVLTLFSSCLTDSIKSGLNRADLRTHQYEELVSEISQYIFNAELTVEFIEKDWTTEPALSDLLKDYNQSIATLRKKEFVFLVWIRKYWDKERVTKYENFMQSVRNFDSAVHSLNDEFEAVNFTESKKKVDRKRAEEALKVMKPAFESMRDNGNLLVTSLE